MISLSDVNQNLPQGLRSIAKQVIPAAWFERIRAKVVVEARTRKIVEGVGRERLLDLIDAVAAGPDLTDPRHGNFGELGVIRPESPMPGPEIEINDSCNINCLR